MSNSSGQSDIEDFERSVALWHEHPEPGVLGDILSFSLHETLQQQIIDLGTKAVQRGIAVTAAQQFILNQLIQSNGKSKGLDLPEPDGETKSQARPMQQRIQELRRLLRSEPANPLALFDFAQLQTAIGRNDVSERSLRTALSLSPNNRLAIRTLARFYVHVGKADRAHALLRRHERTPHDPWLIASEIALADLAGTSSSFIGKGRRMLLDAGKVPTRNFTELAGSLAMAELSSGNLKKARELQRIALLEPTDNVAAQAVDREGQFGIALNAPSIEKAIASSAEARMLRSWLDLDPEAVEAHALQWHNEEPFSSRPIQMLTAMFANQGDMNRALNWLSLGLRSDPGDRGLLINLAYSQAMAGMFDSALTTIGMTRRLHGPDVEPFLLATEGLVAYRLGRFEEGDRFYGDALQLLDSPNRQRSNVSTYCLLNQAIAALNSEHPLASQLTAKAGDAMQKRPSIDAVMMLKLVTSAGEKTPPSINAAAPEQLRQRLTSQWVFDAKANTLVEHRGLTAPGAKPIVVLNRDKAN